ncbi:recombinase family protein [Pseudomonas sp. RL_105y_Pfl1_103]|uniref:recombinase family protein n=1 Tax=Pseudomonas sp. RL_105y_Pfl1_103 TaxID=3088707 RepID=UPI0030DA9249
MTKRVFCYVRFSTKRQSAGDSIERQQSLIDGYLAKSGAVIAEQFTDLGVSAFKGKNVKVGALSRFLQRVREGEIQEGDTLIVESLDRISRQKELDTLEVLISILKAGVIIYTLADERVYDRAAENQANLIFQINFIISRAHEESMTKQRRAVSAWKRKHDEARSGQRIMTRRLPYWLTTSEIEGKQVIVLQESRAQEVKLAFELASFKLGAQSIATRLNAAVPEKRWTLIAVRHLLNSKSVYGCFEAFKTKSQSGELTNGQAYEEIDGYFPAVIAKEEYYKVQSILQANKETNAIRGRTSKGFRNVFKGIITCMHCGSFLHQHFTKRKGHEYMYLICHKSLVKACSSGRKVMIPYRFILEPFLLHFKNFRLDDLVNDKSKVISLEQRLIAAVQERQDKQSSITRIEEEIEANNGQPLRTFTALLTKLESQIDDLNTDIDMLTGEIENLKACNHFASSLTREKLDAILSTEDGRLQINALLSTNDIRLMVKKDYGEDETDLYIQYQKDYLYGIIRFNKSFATLDGQGIYHYRTKEFSPIGADGGRSKLSEEAYEDLKLKAVWERENVRVV